MTKEWIEIKAAGPRAGKDAATVALIEAGSPGVEELEDKPSAVGTLVSYSLWEGEVPAFTESASPEAVLKAYLPQKDTGLVRGLDERLTALGWTLATSAYKDRDWSLSWRSSIKTVKVTCKGVSVIVKPTWKTVAKKKGDILIEIDPGMAFGTGGHATTRMCLKAVTTLLLGSDRKRLLAGMLDVGTGTGLLAIAAKKLGAKKAVGTEIDPVAAKVARKNARMNKAVVVMTLQPLEKIRGRFPLVAANILAGDLMRMSADLAAKVSDNGFLILSGILVHEMETVKNAFRSRGFQDFRDYTSGEWAATILKKAV